MRCIWEWFWNPKCSFLLHIGDGIINTEAISVGQAEVFYGDLMFAPETNIDYFARLLYFDNKV